MIDLAAIARLAEEHADDRGRPVAPLLVGDHSFDTDERPVVMGVVNLSRDSGYRPSIATTTRSAIQRGRVLAAQGADIVDVGAESSNSTSERIGTQAQIDGLVPVIEALASDGLVVSVEGYEPEVLHAGLVAGARVVNLTGSGEDDDVFDLASEHGATVVLCHILGAHARALDGSDVEADPVPALLEHFAARLENAATRGVGSIAIDPGMGFGFTLSDQVARARHQSMMLLNSFRLRRLGVPVCQALPHSFDLFEEQFRIAEGFFAVLAQLGGTVVFRTHEVPHVTAVLGAMRALDVFPQLSDNPSRGGTRDRGVDGNERVGEGGVDGEAPEGS